MSAILFLHYDVNNALWITELANRDGLDNRTGKAYVATSQVVGQDGFTEGGTELKFGS